MKIFSSIGKWISAHKAISVSVAAVLVAAAVGAVLLFALKPAVSDPVPITAEITPTAADVNGVFTESQFLIAGERFADADDLRSQLSAGVETPFELQKTEQGNYLLTFDEPLKPDSMLTFMIDDGKGNDRSYAFQTRSEFGVRSFFPKNGGVAEPNSGVEITFTRDDFTDWENFITVEPAGAYRMEKVGNRVVIIPEKRWEELTTYVVTVKAGLKTASGEEMAEAASATFSTNEDVNAEHLISLGGSFEETFLTTDVPVIELRADTYSNTGRSIGYDFVSFDVTVHRVASADAYAELIRAMETKDVYRRDFRYASYRGYDAVDTSGMETAVKATLNLVPYSQGDYSTCYLILPEELPEGYYVVTASKTLNNKQYVIQKLIQVNDTVVYMRSENKRLFAWVNDAKTASAVSGATVTVDGESAVKTSADGSVSIPLKGGVRAAVVKIENGGRQPFIGSVLLAPEDELPVSDRYYSYIYTDRESYLPTDTINVFGVLRGRYSSALPEKLTVALGEVRYDYDFNAQTHREYIPAEDRLVSVEAAVNDEGVFTAKLPLSAFEHGYYGVAALIGDDAVCCGYVQVEDYTKPAFTVTFDELKDCYKVGETVHFGMTAEYYGGIPAAGEEFIIDGNYYTTDSNGRITVDYPVTAEANYTNWQPAYRYISVKDNVTLDKVNQYGMNFRYLPSTAIITVEADKKDGVAHVAVKTNRYKDNPTAGELDNYYVDADPLRGAAYDTTVSIRVKKYTYDPPTEYTYYDYVAKKTVTTQVYNYTRHEEIVFDSAVASQGGIASVDIALEPLEYGYYEVLASCADENGRLIESTCVVNNDYLYYRNNTNVKHFGLVDTDADNNYDGIGWWDFAKTLKARRTGESFKLDLQDDDGVRPEGGTLMLGIVNEGISEERACASFPIDMTFKEEYAPDVYLVGAFFDGRRIYKMNDAVVPYDYAEKKLDVEITADKEEYRPGDEMKITVSVKDANGSGHSGTVNVSVVDEAQFAVAPQYADLLGSVYGRWVGSGVRDTFVSYTQHSFNGDYSGGGEGGGGGDEGSARQNFVDTAAFETVSVGGSGKAEVTIKLPDNVTDWRVTVNAISDDLYGGSAKINVSASLPFVTDAVVAKTYQTGDDVSFGVHAYGRGVSGGETEFTAKLAKPDGSEQTLTQSAKGNAFTYFNFGQQPEGVYTVTVSGKNGSESDAIAETFRVIANADELPLFKEFDLAGGVDVNALRSPVTLVFSNGNAKYIASALYKLYYSVGGRADQHLAAAVAGRMLASFAPDEEKAFYAVSDIAAGDLQGDKGGVAIYPYAEEDPFVTAFAVWADPDAFNAARVRSYAQSLNETEKYLILAALGDPVLLEVRAKLAEADASDLYSRMIYACALAALGDDAGAEAEFNATFRPLVSESVSGSAFIKAGDDGDINDRLTAMALTIVSRTDRSLAKRLMKHICDIEKPTDFYGLQQVIYAENMLRGAYGSASFEYAGGSVTLEGTATKTVRMTAEQLAAANFKVTEGSVDVTAYYTGGADELDVSGATYTVSKRVEPVRGGKISVGDKVRVTIDVSGVKNKQSVNIMDYVPSGFRFSEYDYNESSHAWLCDQDGQRVTICAWSEGGSARAVFYVRAVTPGTFAVNSAYACDSENAWGFSGRSTVTVE
ncbi:MAG: hypothetical protein J5441_03150 [Clostridia bacterium]|nr:hypothetical protein [Clostridia bacterium]